jgi:large subunit ribosomal protein L11
LLKAANLAKGSSEPNRDKVGTVSKAQIEEIAQGKMPDLNTTDIEAACRIIAGTARSMGILVEGM